MLQGFSSAWRRWVGAGTRLPAGDDLCEALEPRLAMFNSPFLQNPPALGDLASSDNTVVRFQLNQGIVDLELFDVTGPDGLTSSAAPRTTANFLRYVSSGRYDNTFFHRYARREPDEGEELGDPFVLQGGGFALRDPLPNAAPRFRSVESFGTIVNEFASSRSNIERTVAMAKIGGNPDSATSQFFINLRDNASTLDGQNGGFTVFGRIVGGWDVITRIQDFRQRDLNQFLAGGSGAFSEVPLSNNDGTGNNPSEYVGIIDVEVLKARNVRQFFAFNAFYPDGFRSPRVTTDVFLVNQDLAAESEFQIIARFEQGQRDVVVMTGRLEAGAQRTVRIVDGLGQLNRVRPGFTFSLEVRATRPVSAQWIHRDFGATASESFVALQPFNTGQATSWSFASGQKGPGVSTFLPFFNPNGTDVTVTINFTSETGSTLTLTTVVKPYRRGGINVSDTPGVPTGGFAVTVSGTAPIVAALSQYRALPARAGADTGAPGGGGAVGVLPGAIIPVGGQSTIALAYRGSAATSVTVDLEFTLSNGTVLTGTPVVLTTLIPRREISLASAGATLPTGQFFSIRYRVRDAAANVSGTYTSTSAADTARAAFQVLATPRSYFAGGFTDSLSADGDEHVSIFNPYTSAANATVTYRVRFHFVGSAGEEVILPAAGAGALEPGRRIDLRVRDLAEVMTRVNSGLQFRRYGVSVEAIVSQGGSERPGAVIAQLTRTSPTTLLATGPGLQGDRNAIPLNDARFTSPNSGTDPG